jgi:hypothetical protein
LPTHCKKRQCGEFDEFDLNAFFEADGSGKKASFKYKDARLVFLSNMCFDKQTQDAIFQKLSAEMPKGSLVFCSRLPDSSLPAFETVGVERVPMTWTPTSEIHILRHL